jgi:tetratricopeptide (TPR) repeat protein
MEVKAESTPEILVSPSSQDRTLEEIDRYMERAQRDYQSGNTLAAISDYSAAIRLDPDLAIAYNNRAIAKIQIRDYRGALLDYSQVIRIEPDKAIAYNNRAVLRQQLGDCRGAVSDLVLAAKLFRQQGNTSDYERTIANLSRFQKLLKN